MTTVGAVLKFVLTVFAAVPAIKSIWDNLIALYIEQEIARMRADNREAIRKAFHDFDQRPLENAIRSPRAGKPSGIAGTELRDSLPGVVQDPNKK